MWVGERERERISLTEFVSRDVQVTLWQGDELPLFAAGTVLFVDIARFSSIASNLVAQHGATAGAERLSVLLEQAYSALIAPVHTLGGAIIGFSGDAITCWFADSSEPGCVTLGASRAIDAALEMRSALLNLNVGSAIWSGSERLAATFCIATGDAWRAEVGVPAIQRFSLLGGAPLQRVAAAETLAAPGQILLDLATADAVRESTLPEFATGAAAVDALRRSSVQGDFLVLAADAGARASFEPSFESDANFSAKPRGSNSAVPDALTPGAGGSPLLEWIPHLARERLQQAPEFLATFKPVVAVFIQFGQATGQATDREGDEIVTPLDAVAVATFVNRTQAVFESYGGRVVDVTVGEKGSYLFAAFGDLRVHEDDSRRALLALLALQADRTLQCQAQTQAQTPTTVGGFSAGIARGPAYAGLIGGAGRRTFGVIGLDVTLAARLMVAAEPGEVLVASSVMRVVGAEFNFANERTQRFKGFTEPVSVARFSGQRTSVVRSGRPTAGVAADARSEAEQELFGREDAVALLDEAVQRLLAGSGGLTELTGEPGIGKTALLRHVCARAQAAGVRVLTGVGRPLSGGAFSLWRDIEPGVTGFKERVFDSELGAAGRLARLTEELVAVITTVAAAEPVLFALEDLHWADPESLLVLRQLVIAAPNALIVTTSRSDAFKMDPGLIPVSWPAQRIDLEALPVLAQRQLIATTLGASTVATPILEFVTEQAGGSPLFAQELALSLRDSGVVRVTAGQARLRDATTTLDASTSTETVQSIMAARIDELPLFEQTLVKAASVIGREFPLAMLEEVVLESTADQVAKLDDAGTQDFPQALSNLVDRDILQLVDDGKYFGFRHALAQQVAYSTLLHQHRARLHLRVALWLEASGAGDSATLLQLAHHWWHAAKELHSPSATDSALVFLERAGERALSLSAHAEALSCFQRAIELADEDERALKRDRLAHWHASVAASELGLSRFKDCAQSCRKALHLLGYPLPQRTGRAIFGAMFRQLHLRVRGRGFQRNVGLPELPDDQSRERLRRASELLRMMSKSYFFANDAIAMVFLNLHNMNISEGLEPGPEKALSYTVAQLTLAGLNSHSWAQAYGRESLAMAPYVEDPAARATLYLNCAVYRLSIGDWQQARTLTRNAEALASKRGDFAQLAETVALRADVELIVGNVEKSSELYQRLFVEAERRGRWLEQAWSVRPEAQRELRAGRHDNASALLERHLGVLAPVNDSLVAIDVQGMRALAFARAGEYAQATAAATQALTLIELVSPPRSYPRYFGLVALVEALLLVDSGNSREAGGAEIVCSASTRQAIDALAVYAAKFPYAAASSELMKGWVAARQGKQRAAAKHLRRAREVARTFGLIYEDARSCAMLAAVSNNAVERESCAALAAACFADMDIGASAQQLETNLKIEWQGNA